MTTLTAATRTTTRTSVSPLAMGGVLGVGGTVDVAEVHAQLTEVVDALVGVTVDDLDEPGLLAELSAIERATRRLGARSARVAAALAQRRARAAREARPDDARAGEKARRELQRELVDGLEWTPGQADTAVRLGEQFGASQAAQAAFDGGELSPRHAAQLAKTLRHIEEDDVRDRVEADLVAAARSQDASTFGRTCRRLLAQLDHEAAVQAEQRRRSRRYARVHQTDDGMQAVHAELSGVGGETFVTALYAFRRPDAAGEHRTPEQATADALVAMAEAALRGGEAPTKHGVRPHVVVTIDWQSILRGAGVAETVWSGALPFEEIRQLLADCDVSRLLVDARGVPTEAGEAVRTVPVGHYRALVHRDRGCIADGCDVPAQWTQVMHLATPYRFEGRLTIETAGLGCAYHHRKLDHEGWTVTWRDGRPILHHPDRPPRAGPD